MPYDGNPSDFTLPAVKTGPDPVLKEGLAGLAQLSEALRHPEWWTAHKWRFGQTYHQHNCGTVGCAWGVGVVLWPENFKPIAGCDVENSVVRLFGIRWKHAHSIFASANCYDVERVSRVTPTMVADAIDRLLAEKGYRG